MTEVLFILTTIFVAYVIYVIVNDPAKKSNPQDKQSKPEKPVAAVKQTPTQSATHHEKAPAETKSVIESTNTPETSTAPEPTKRGLKDPKTGEVAMTYSNYRFTKRWIKEALVAEGLVEKIYKNNELNPDLEEKIKDAVIKLEAMAKYQA